MKSYSLDLRQRIVNARENGETAALVALRFNVSKRSVERYWELYCQRASLIPAPRGGSRKSRLLPHHAKLKRWVKQQPDITIEEMIARCETELGVQIKSTALWHQLNHLNLTFKKNAARRRTTSPRHKKSASALA